MSKYFTIIPNLWLVIRFSVEYLNISKIFIFLFVFLLHRVVICLLVFQTNFQMFLKKILSVFLVIVILTDNNFIVDCCGDFIIFVFKVMCCILLIFVVNGPVHYTVNGQCLDVASIQRTRVSRSVLNSLKMTIQNSEFRVLLLLI